MTRICVSRSLAVKDILVSLSPFLHLSQIWLSSERWQWSLDCSWSVFSSLQIFPPPKAGRRLNVKTQRYSKGVLEICHSPSQMFGIKSFVYIRLRIVRVFKVPRQNEKYFNPALAWPKAGLWQSLKGVEGESRTEECTEYTCTKIKGKLAMWIDRPDTWVD